ncbi:MAG TPA: hypothetical protein VET65_04310 [Candidatus Limnocylindrales bacterium]|nr:hypothetical protein [Candidatus Limnocylindrales bacterium]
MIRGFDSGRLLRLLLFCALFSLAVLPPTDPDLFWHLANGQLLLQLHGWPTTDLYSFSATGHPWVMHEWLADLFMYGIVRLGGLSLLVVVFAGLTTVAGVCLYRLLRSVGLHPTAAVVVTLVGALASSTTWGARPQVFNLVLAGLLLLGLRAVRVSRLPAFWIAPYLWLWANLHSGFLVGVALAALFCAGEGWDAWRAADPERLRATFRPAIATGAGLLLSLVNPYGVQTLLFPLGTLTSPLIQANIQEWASPNFQTLPGYLLEALLFLMLAGLATRAVRARTSEWLWALALLFLALSSQRHVPLFVLAAAPLYGRCAQAVLARLAAWTPRQAALPAERVAFLPRAIASRRPTLAVGILNVSLLLAVGTGMIVDRALPSIRPASQQAAIDAVFPVETAQALIALQRPVRVFNAYDWGGYLIGAGRSAGVRVFIDGRVEVYGPAVFQDYLAVNNLAPSWRQVLDRYQPDAVLFPTGHPLTTLLSQDPTWRKQAQDRVATLFVRAGAP